MSMDADNRSRTISREKASIYAGFRTSLGCLRNQILVELSGIEPLTSSLRIQGTASDGETLNDTE